jgi:hypothetical protein
MVDIQHAVRTTSSTPTLGSCKTCTHLHHLNPLLVKLWVPGGPALLDVEAALELLQLGLQVLPDLRRASLAVDHTQGAVRQRIIQVLHLAVQLLQSLLLHEQPHVLCVLVPRASPGLGAAGERTHVTRGAAAVQDQLQPGCLGLVGVDAPFQLGLALRKALLCRHQRLGELLHLQQGQQFG